VIADGAEALGAFAAGVGAEPEAPVVAAPLGGVDWDTGVLEAPHPVMARHARTATQIASRLEPRICLIVPLLMETAQSTSASAVVAARSGVFARYWPVLVAVHEAACSGPDLTSLSVWQPVSVKLAAI